MSYPAQTNPAEDSTHKSTMVRKEICCRRSRRRRRRRRRTRRLERTSSFTRKQQRTGKKWVPGRCSCWTTRGATGFHQRSWRIFRGLVEKSRECTCQSYESV